MKDRAEKSTADLVALWQEAQTADPSHHWGWVYLARLHKEAGQLPQYLTAADHPFQTAQDDRERSVALDELGDGLVKAGRLEEAQQRFEASLKIIEKLAVGNASSAEAQRDLIISCGKLAQLSGDKSYWRRALTITETLQRENRLAPTDAWMLPELRRQAN